MRKILCALLCLAAAACAAEQGAESDDKEPAPMLAQNGKPVFFKHPYVDGLYSTVTAMNTFWVPELKQMKKTKLKVPGFKNSVPVFAIMQDYAAPLVVVLQGVDGKVDGPFGDLWPYWYSQAGYHVLTFDNNYTPQWPEISGKGVVGNFEADADQVAQVIDAFLKTQDPQKRITKVGVIGMSFGATQALILAEKDKAGQLPFKLEGCLALSPPVKMKTAGQIVDRFFVEDRWNTTMVELGEKFGPHVPVAEGQPIPFTPTEMRAAIGFVFRDGLAQVIDRNDSYYNLKILPRPNGEEDRKGYAEATSFQRYIEKFTFPYWQKSVKSVDDLWRMNELASILPKLPDYAEAIVAENDPFNTAEDLAEAKAADVNKRMTVLPRGGHLGYVAADWTLVKALRIFGKPAEAEDKDALKLVPPPENGKASGK